MNFWSVLAEILTDEFSDLARPDQAIRMMLRLLLAVVLGGVLGFEREHRGKAAGVRTHMMVALGGALFVLIPEQLGVSDDALSRVMQGVVAGVGFLCAGTILKNGEEPHVTGLTTAAGIWFTTAIGIAVGLGRLGSAVLATLLALLVLNTIRHFIGWLESRGKD